MQVAHAVVVVEDLAGGGIVVQRIDGEVAPCRILFHVAPDVVAQHAAMFVLERVGVMGGAEGRDFDGFGTEHHMYDLEAATDHA